MRPNRACGAGEERGVALVEFALVAPILLVILLGILDFGKAFNYWIDQTQLASAGARWAVVDAAPGSARTAPARRRSSIHPVSGRHAGAPERRHHLARQGEGLHQLSAGVRPHEPAHRRSRPRHGDRVYRWLPLIGQKLSVGDDHHRRSHDAARGDADLHRGVLRVTARTRSGDAERGGVLVLTALWMPVVILGSLVIDAGNWFEHRRHLQTQADAGRSPAAGSSTGASGPVRGERGHRG